LTSNIPWHEFSLKNVLHQLTTHTALEQDAANGARFHHQKECDQAPNHCHSLQKSNDTTIKDVSSVCVNLSFVKDNPDFFRATKNKNSKPLGKHMFQKTKAACYKCLLLYNCPAEVSCQKLHHLIEH
jgi:hypothetical protein